MIHDLLYVYVCIWNTCTVFWGYFLCTRKKFLLKLQQNLHKHLLPNVQNRCHFLFSTESLNGAKVFLEFCFEEKQYYLLEMDTIGINIINISTLGIKKILKKKVLWCRYFEHCFHLPFPFCHAEGAPLPLPLGFL